MSGLNDHSRILDVGCGIGRIAIAIAEHFGRSVTYEGFDNWKPGIEWCRENISVLYPNFNFQTFDVRNREYNPNGMIEPKQFLFPYPDSYFDFIVLNSVFTHMELSHIDHYLSEISRTLRLRGLVYATFFLDGHPRSGLAYPSRAIVNLYQKHELRVFRVVRGSWRKTQLRGLGLVRHLWVTNMMSFPQLRIFHLSKRVPRLFAKPKSDKTYVDQPYQDTLLASRMQSW